MWQHDEPGRCYAKLNKPATEGHDSDYIRNLRDQIHRNRKQNVGFQGLGVRRMGRFSAGIKSQLYKANTYNFLSRVNSALLCSEIVVRVDAMLYSYRNNK